MRISNPIRFSLALLALGMPAAASAQDVRPDHEGSPLIQIVFVHKESGEGRIAAESSYLPPEDEGPFYLEEPAILADPQLRHVQIGHGREGEMALILTFTPEGVAMLKDATSARVGSLIGLTLDSHLVTVTRIITPFSGQGDHLTVSLSPQLPKEFRTAAANKIRAQWPDEGR